MIYIFISEFRKSMPNCLNPYQRNHAIKPIIRYHQCVIPNVNKMLSLITVVWISVNHFVQLTECSIWSTYSWRRRRWDQITPSQHIPIMFQGTHKLRPTLFLFSSTTMKVKFLIASLWYPCNKSVTKIIVERFWK